MAMQRELWHFDVMMTAGACNGLRIIKTALGGKAKPMTTASSAAVLLSNLICSQLLTGSLGCSSTTSETLLGCEGAPEWRSALLGMSRVVEGKVGPRRG